LAKFIKNSVSNVMLSMPWLHTYCIRFE
jgi:hypothetical protein